MNIAIVDDEEIFLKSLHEKIDRLEVSDYIVHEFQSGESFLSVFEKGKYDIIILDVEMPGINGLKTAEKIRELDKSVILSFLTNYSEFAIQGYEVNAFRYILKTQPDYLYMQQLQSIFDEYRQTHKVYAYSNQNMSFKYKLIDMICPGIISMQHPVKINMTIPVCSSSLSGSVTIFTVQIMMMHPCSASSFSIISAIRMNPF